MDTCNCCQVFGGPGEAGGVEFSRNIIAYACLVKTASFVTLPVALARFASYDGNWLFFTKCFSFPLEKHGRCIYFIIEFSVAFCFQISKWILYLFLRCEICLKTN